MRKNILYIIPVLIILFPGLLISTSSDVYDFFFLKYPYTIGTGNLIFNSGSDVKFFRNDLTNVRSFFTGVTAGFTSKFNLSLSISYIDFEGTGKTGEMFSNEYPFAGTGNEKGLGYLTLGGNYVVKQLTRSVISTYLYADIPLSDRFKSVTTTKPRFGFEIQYYTEIFKKTLLFVYGGFRKNIDSENSDLSDEFNYGLGISQYFGKSFFLFSRFGGSVYSKVISSGLKGYLFSVVGAGYGLGRSFGISLAYKKVVDLDKKRISGSGIVGSLFYFPGKRGPRCVKLKSLSIKGLKSCTAGSSVEYFLEFTPSSVTGPVNYEWSCSDNGDIISGMWSPMVSVEWKSEKEDSHIEISVSNGCSVLKKKISVKVLKKEI